MIRHTPKSEDEVSEIVKSAAKRKAALSIKGGGTRPIGNAVQADEVLVTTGMKGISLYEPGALTIVADAGTTLEAINKELAKENQHLPFEPADYSGLFSVKGKSTIGGVVAAGVSGPRRIQVGACRDSLIGVRFVDGEGTIIKNGGRVMKNVTGYDLVKLLAGSYGTLGVLTEVAFKVLPKPEVTGVISVSGLEDVQAIELLAKALSTPFDVSGAAHIADYNEGIAQTFVRVEGFEKSIKYRTKQLKELIQPMLPKSAELSIDMKDKSAAKIWDNVRNIEPLHGKEGEIWRLSVKPSNGPMIVNELKKSISLETVYDWAGGLVWLSVSDPSAENAKLIRNTVKRFGGHATIIKSAKGQKPSAEAFHPEPSRVAELSASLRRQFDPAGILNPGLMASDLVGA